ACGNRRRGRSNQSKDSGKRGVGPPSGARISRRRLLTRNNSHARILQAGLADAKKYHPRMVRPFGGLSVQAAHDHRYREARACSHYSQRFDDECEAQESQKQDVEFFKAGEDTAESFESAE